MCERGSIKFKRDKKRIDKIISDIRRTNFDLTARHSLLICAQRYRITLRYVRPLCSLLFCPCALLEFFVLELTGARAKLVSFLQKNEKQDERTPPEQNYIGG